MRVGLIFGGRSSEHEVSIRSARAIYNGLIANGYDVVSFGIARDGRWLDSEESKNILINADLSEAKATKNSCITSFIELAESKDLSKKLDLVFPIVHGTSGEDGALQGFFRLLNVPFVASDVLGSAICMDKDVAKRLLLAAGIDCAPYVCIHSHEIGSINIDDLVKRLGLPLFIKPANQGSSVGISKVTDQAGLISAIKYASQFDKKVLIEKFIKGREIECSVMGNELPEASVPGEILPAEEFYSYNAKYSATSKTTTSSNADMPVKLKNMIQEVAKQTYRVLECEGMARVDFFVEDSGKMWVNEVNTIPGFTSISMYPKMWESTGVTFSQLLDKLVQYGLARHKRDSALKLSPA
jgi:D-alanine-D-alanine ligase